MQWTHGIKPFQKLTKQVYNGPRGVKSMASILSVYQ